MGLLERVAEYAKWISAIFALAVIFVKPFREWLFGLSAIRDGQNASYGPKCFIFTMSIRTARRSGSTSTKISCISTLRTKR